MPLGTALCIGFFLGAIAGFLIAWTGRDKSH
jgi:hypothetical protein